VERLRQDARVSDPRVLEAFTRVPRHVFVSEDQRASAYEDRALPLVESQTISQPTMIAIMLDALGCQPGDRALEVGGGSGYAAAVLACLVAEVHAIEIRPQLAARARDNLSVLELTNVHVHVGDGRWGLPNLAPFQRILVSAGAPDVPSALVEQLGRGGRIAIPVDDGHGQTLQVGTRREDGQVEWTQSVACVFVPLVTGVAQ